MLLHTIYYIFLVAQGTKAFAPFRTGPIGLSQAPCSEPGIILKSVNGLDNSNGDNGINGINGDASTGTGISEEMKVCQESLEQYEQVMEFFMFELGNDMIFLADEAETSNFIQRNFDVILFDRDGVFCRGKDAIPEVVESLKSLLLKSDKKVLFVVDNYVHEKADALASEVVELSQILDVDLNEDQIISSTDDLEFDPSRALFITDRMDSVVKSAKEGGMKSALVLTGNTTGEELIEVSSSAEIDATLPHIIFPHAGLIQLTSN